MATRGNGLSRAEQLNGSSLIARAPVINDNGDKNAEHGAYAEC